MPPSRTKRKYTTSTRLPKLQDNNILGFSPLYNKGYQPPCSNKATHPGKKANTRAQYQLYIFGYPSDKLCRACAQEANKIWDYYAKVEPINQSTH